MGILKKVFKKSKEKSEKEEDKDIKLDKDSKEEAPKLEIIKEEKDDKKKDKKQVAVEADENKKSSTEKVSGIFFDVLVKPLLTEKITGLNKQNKYVFEVFRNVNKIEIKKAIKELYGVMPIDVNVINVMGKKIGVMRGRRGKRKSWKKAIITLKAGDSISLYGSEEKK